MNRVERKIRNILRKRGNEYLGQFPQIAQFAFDDLAIEVNLMGRYEREELAALEKQVLPNMPDRRVCLDIGANIGNHSLFFAEHFAEVIAFEPNPRTFRLLQFNSELADNIRPVNMGASDAKGAVTAQVDHTNIGATTTDEALRLKHLNSKLSQVTFQLDCIDSILGVRADIDFIKLDVEGHELKALHGCKDTLAASNAVIAFEAHADSFSNGTSEVMEFLRDLGYRHFHSLPGKQPDPLRRWPKAIRKLAAMLPESPAAERGLTEIKTFGKYFYPMIMASRNQILVIDDTLRP